MFRLTEPLEKYVSIRNKKVIVDFSFDTVILWYQLLEDQTISSEDKISIAFDNFIDHQFIPALSLEEKVEVVDSISKYIKESPYGNNFIQESDENHVTDDHFSNELFSYTQDAGAIYASFLFDYGIDLDLERGKLHYDKFKALLAALSEKSYFKRILSIRQALPNEYEGEALANLLEAKDYYSLDSDRSVENLNDQMGDIFNMLKAQADS